jgi:hypothetical protein
MYYCLRCRRVHSTGSITNHHKVFASRAWRNKRHQPRRNILTVVNIMKTPKASVPFLKPSKSLYSRSTRAKNLLKPVDIHERAMAERIQKQSGMTHIQTMQIIRKARDSDFDVEQGVDWGLSKDRKETYEFAVKQLTVGSNPLKKSMRDLYAEASMYGFG